MPRSIQPRMVSILSNWPQHRRGSMLLRKGRAIICRRRKPKVTEYMHRIAVRLKYLVEGKGQQCLAGDRRIGNGFIHGRLLPSWGSIAQPCLGSIEPSIESATLKPACEKVAVACCSPTIDPCACPQLDRADGRNQKCRSHVSLSSTAMIELSRRVYSS